MKQQLYILLILLSCKLSAQSFDLKEYYFPYADFFEPRIYQYTEKGDNEESQYWYMQTKIINNDTILSTKVYDEDFALVEVSEEKVHPKGMTILKYNLSLAGTMTISKILHKDVFRWKLSSEEKIKWSALYDSPYGKESIRKQRELISTKPHLQSFNKEEHQTIEFKDSYRHSVRTTDGARTYDFHQKSYYGKGIGLLNYKRSFPKNKSSYEYYLSKIFTKEAWEKFRKKAKYYKGGNIKKT